jgi:hypothetical protein
LDLCAASLNFTRDIYFIDASSDFGPGNASEQVTQESSLVIDASQALHFVDASACVPVVDGCYQYCVNTCLRTVVFSVDPSRSKKLMLWVCLRGTQDCERYSGNEFIQGL